MFSKRQPQTATITVIAAGAVIEGTLRVQGTVQVDGSVDGTLMAEGQVSIGPKGQVTGDIEADALTVGGLVEGGVMVRGHLHVLSSGKVQGEARYASLEVDRGGVVDGRSSVLEAQSAEVASGDDEEGESLSDNDNDNAAVQAFDAAE